MSKTHNIEIFDNDQPLTVNQLVASNVAMQHEIKKLVQVFVIEDEGGNDLFYTVWSPMDTGDLTLALSVLQKTILDSLF